GGEAGRGVGEGGVERGGGRRGGWGGGPRCLGGGGDRFLPADDGRLAGSETQMAATIRLQREPFDAAGEAAKLRRGRGDIGAVVTFTGVCRSDESGAPLAAMTLEHYPGMAEAEIARHVEAAEQRWQLLGVTVIHRHGRLTPGEDIVLVVSAAAHRQEAFAAAEFLMDYLKTRAPFWKQGEDADHKAWVQTD